jgi:L-cysteine S-thiosulfotransferase
MTGAAMPRLGLARLGLVLVLVSGAAAAADIPAAERRSGYDFMGPETRAMQDDDSANPGMLWVLDGEAMWSRKEGAANRSCADCHGAAEASMSGVAARYPRFEASAGRPVDLQQRINMCRAGHEQAPALAYESKEMLALTAYVAVQSRGQKIAIADDAETLPFIAAGRALFERREGQLNLSCAQCHNDNWSQKLAGSPVTQGQPTGYPLYRLEWQSVGSLQRRMRACMVGVRAEPYDYGAPDNVELELYLMWRARGLALEAPGVRP